MPPRDFRPPRSAHRAIRRWRRPSAPKPGDWLYFVTIDMQGTTLFTKDYRQHLANIELAKRNGVLDSVR